MSTHAPKQNKPAVSLITEDGMQLDYSSPAPVLIILDKLII